MYVQTQPNTLYVYHQKKKKVPKNFNSIKGANITFKPNPTSNDYLNFSKYK